MVASIFTAQSSVVKYDWESIKSFMITKRDKKQLLSDLQSFARKLQHSIPTALVLSTRFREATSTRETYEHFSYTLKENYFTVVRIQKMTTVRNFLARIGIKGKEREGVDGKGKKQLCKKSVENHTPLQSSGKIPGEKWIIWSIEDGKEVGFIAIW